MLKWTPGRQNGSYFKKLVYQFKCFGFGFDCYLLKYPTGSFIQRHIDPVDKMDHYRLNIIVKLAEKGGVFTSDKSVFRLGARFVLFRPDQTKHAVSLVEYGTRYVISFGFAKPKRGA